jgi:hypothetical protein
MAQITTERQYNDNFTKLIRERLSNSEYEAIEFKKKYLGDFGLGCESTWYICKRGTKEKTGLITDIYNSEYSVTSRDIVLLELLLPICEEFEKDWRRQTKLIHITR